jgi:ribosome-binding protein aMBF1 (putative translation factor)
MRCYLCQSTKNLSKYSVDSSTIFVCQDCEEELLIENYIELEDKICEKPIFSEENSALAYACA